MQLPHSRAPPCLLALRPSAPAPISPQPLPQRKRPLPFVPRLFSFPSNPRPRVRCLGRVRGVRARGGWTAVGGRRRARSSSAFRVLVARGGAGGRAASRAYAGRADAQRLRRPAMRPQVSATAKGPATSAIATTCADAGQTRNGRRASGSACTWERPVHEGAKIPFPGSSPLERNRRGPAQST